MKKILLFFFVISFTTLQGQVTFENAFPNLTFNYPVEIQNTGVSGDNRLFVVEQPGRIRVFQNQSNTSFSSVFLDITNKVNYTQGQEKGLLGLAFHPNFNQNGFFYVSYTGNNGGLIEIIIERYSVNSNNPNQANSNSGCEVLSFTKNQNNSNHNGGSIAFGPDGFLYISVGDGGGSGDPQGNAQNLNRLFGKILRIDINAPCPGYNIPSSNPLTSSSGRNEIYAWGLRNTWKMSFDFQTNRLWGGDVGQSQFEEINIIQNGRNYGWNRFEAFSTFNFSTQNPNNPAFPIFNYNHGQNDRSITGGYVYRGSAIGNLFGRYIFGDFASGRIWSLDYNSQSGATNRTLLFDTNFSVSTFGKDINNELYFADYGFTGRIYKIVDNNTNTPPPPPPSSCSVTTGNCSITINGLNSGNIAKVFNSSFQQIWICTPFGNNPNPCNSSETITGLANGTYFVQACGVTESYTVSCSNNPPSGGGGGSTGGCSVSTSNCSITLNGLNSGDFIKVFDASFQEIWRCSQFGNNPNICNSNETISNLANGTYFVQACGVTEPYTVNCNNNPPSGGGGNTGGGGTGGCSVSANNCTITLSGLNSGDFIKVFDASFNEVWRCSQFGGSNPNICNSTETITGLASGTYFVQACGVTEPYVLSGCSGNGGGGNNGGSNNGCSSVSNVAQGKNASQSSTISSGGITGSASKAIDGNTNGVFFSSNSSVSATQNQSRPFWQVDLQGNHFIESINVYNRTDGSSRANNAYVLVSDQPFTSSSLSTSRSQADYEFFLSGNVGTPSVVSPNIVGRYVRIQMQDQGFLTLAEVQVMGCTSNNFNSNFNTLITFPNTDFLFFDGEKKERAVELLWATNMEPMNEFFVLQRSQNGVDFEILQEIDSRGNSISTEFYKTLDEEPYLGRNYYRLVQILTDGTIINSNTYTVDFELDLNSFVIFPNPAQDEIHINLKPFAGKQALIQIFNAQGVLVKTHQVDEASTYPERIDLNGIVNGLYLMSVKLEGHRLMTQPFNIKKTY